MQVQVHASMNPSTTSSVASLGNIGRWAVAPSNKLRFYIYTDGTHTHMEDDQKIIDLHANEKNITLCSAPARTRRAHEQHQRSHCYTEPSSPVCEALLLKNIQYMDSWPSPNMGELHKLWPWHIATMNWFISQWTTWPTDLFRSQEFISWLNSYRLRPALR